MVLCALARAAGLGCGPLADQLAEDEIGVCNDPDSTDGMTNDETMH